MSRPAYRLDGWLGSLVSRLAGPVSPAARIRWRPGPATSGPATSGPLSPSPSSTAPAPEPATAPVSEPAEADSLADTIRLTLAEVGEDGISMTELGRRLEVGRGALRPRLRRMIDDGEVERIGAGLATRYRRR